MKKTKGRTFKTGAYRDTDARKLDFEGFICPKAFIRYAQYMDKHRLQSNGVLRDSDNWQLGIPKNVYMKSLYRHFVDVWCEHRGINTEAGLEDALCAILFNTFGYLHEVMKEKDL